MLICVKILAPNLCLILRTPEYDVLDRKRNDVDEKEHTNVRVAKCMTLYYVMIAVTA